MMEDTLSVSSSGSAEDNNVINNEISTSQQIPVLFGGHNKYEWVYLLICVLNGILLISLSGLAIALNENHSPHGDAFVRVQLMSCLLTGVSLVCAIYGLFGEHQYDLHLHCVIMMLAVLSSWVGIGMKAKPSLMYIIWNSVVTLLSIVSFPLAWKATHVPDWVEFWIIGVSEVLTDMYRQMCYFLALLRLDTLLVVVFAYYASTHAFAISKYAFQWQWWLGYQFAMIAYALLSWSCGKLSVVKEAIFLVKGFQVVNAAYVCYLLAQVGLIFRQLFTEAGMQTTLLLSTSIILGLLCIATRIYLMVQIHRTCRTFGHGLNTPSFNELVTRNSNNLLSHPRSDHRF